MSQGLTVSQWRKLINLALSMPDATDEEIVKKGRRLLGKWVQPEWVREARRMDRPL